MGIRPLPQVQVLNHKIFAYEGPLRIWYYTDDYSELGGIDTFADVSPFRIYHKF